MTRMEQLNEFLDGCCLIEYVGNLFEYIGHTKQGKIMLSDINNGDCIERTAETILNDRDFAFIQ